ncbi:hypothetical protein [Streptomyces sp. 2A115]|uniref:hypothetical protein n=1 Tax=Streptomyces sp. 2A115 TaxID=3457439 RepID=UPI003FD5C331
MVSDFDLAWLERGGEVHKPLGYAADVAFEDIAPVRDFPSCQRPSLAPRWRTRSPSSLLAPGRYALHYLPRPDPLLSAEPVESAGDAASRGADAPA